MTIVIWDGETLVADRRTTRVDYKTAEYRYTCSTKLNTFINLYYLPDEPILVNGFSGNVKAIDSFVNFLKNMSSRPLSEVIAEHFNIHYQIPFSGILITEKRSILLAGKCPTATIHGIN